MQSHELFQKMGDSKAREILMYFRENERNVYKTAIGTLAEPKKLRPIFVLQKSVPDQVSWMLKELTHKRGEGVAEQLLQVWLLQARQAMLIQFLDGLGIAHDGKGAVDDLPDELDREKFPPTIDSLLATFEPTEVAIYLHVFNEQTPNGWAEISQTLESDARLALG
ncbi:MAG: hypothetical protein ACKO2G_12425 [Verrucomicrobiales bacterium]